MQDPPNLDEMLCSVAEFLKAEIAPELPDPRLKFRALVAANVLQVCRRELQLEPEILRAELERLTRILRSDFDAGDSAGSEPSGSSSPSIEQCVAEQNSTLAQRLREGSIEAKPGSTVWSHLRQTTVDKLRVANPRCLQRRREERSAASAHGSPEEGC